MSAKFEQYAVPIHCPKCGARIEKTVGWLRANDRLVCPCGTTSYLEPTEVIAAVETLLGALRRIVKPAPDAGKVLA
jgi:hypothetical protein